uniref:Uncharacterized protein n=1 Tax=Setaria viridis TaxID=4556 RepID=A0A4U6W691_SETVI|nr:hypothetical protein SEVIR_1G094100v2 [Setaria viridis]
MPAGVETRRREDEDVASAWQCRSRGRRRRGRGRGDPAGEGGERRSGQGAQGRSRRRSEAGVAGAGREREPSGASRGCFGNKLDRDLAIPGAGFSVNNQIAIYSRSNLGSLLKIEVEFCENI